MSDLTAVPDEDCNIVGGSSTDDVAIDHDAELGALRKANLQRMGRLEAMGVGTNAPAVLLGAMVEVVFPDPSTRTQFLLVVERRLAANLEYAEKQVSGLVVPGAGPNRAARRRAERGR